MMDDLYMIAIALLLPLTAGMLVFQTNPYHALVIRGILGALAALVYVLFGAADVALTEALVGTMLSVTLYAIAVRSSMRMRLGLVMSEADLDEAVPTLQEAKLLSHLRTVLNPHHLHLETVWFTTIYDLQSALEHKDLHGILIHQPHSHALTSEESLYELQVRIPRLAEIIQADWPEAIAKLTVVESENSSSTDVVSLNPGVDP